MTRRKRQFSLSLNKDMPDTSFPSGQRVLPNSDVVTEISLLEENIAWYHHARITGIYIKVAGDVWKATLKAEMGSGPHVAYLIGNSLFELVATLHEYTKNGYLDWHPDSYPNTLAKRSGMYRRPTSL